MKAASRQPQRSMNKAAVEMRAGQRNDIKERQLRLQRARAQGQGGAPPGSEAAGEKQSGSAASPMQGRLLEEPPASQRERACSPESESGVPRGPTIGAKGGPDRTQTQLSVQDIGLGIDPREAGDDTKD